MDGNNTSQVPYVEEDDLIASNEVDLELDDRDIPKTGMIFSCYGVMYDYCKDYAMKTGWAIRTRSNSKRDGALKYVQLVCSRAFRGKSLKESEPKSSQITGCSTRIRAVLNSDGEYKLTTICLEHNHHLCPEATRRIRQYRGLDQHSKHRFSSNQDAGVRPSKNIHAILTEKGGYANLGYTVKDARNFINKRTTLKLQSGDADALHRYFIMMQKNNPEFFYSIDVDDKGRLRNVFWADARSRAACEDFGDVITFDTTCLTNKYDMPFAPFVGVNHHGQSILLGCGLLCDETTMSFIWLYEEWKKCMKGKSPNAIITDQCAAMKNAIVVVFPDAKHRWCLWHIMEKIPKKLRHYKKSYEGVKSSMTDAVYEALSIDDFEREWTSMREKYFPDGDNWLDELYKERHRWVPIFLKDKFWAGMSTTQRSESINAFFDKFVKSTTSLKIFVEQYGAAMADKIEKEEQEEFNTLYRSIEPFSGFKFEKQFRDAYTNVKFKEFQDELRANVYCNSWPAKEEGARCTHKVMESRFKKKRKGGRKQKVFLKASVKKELKYKGPICQYVLFDKDSNDIKCTCRLFEFRGILCRHIISVLIQREVATVSDKYVLTRWKKSLKRKYSLIKGCYDDPKFKEVRTLQNKMLEAFHDLVNFVEGKMQTDIVLQGITELKAKVIQSKPVPNLKVDSSSLEEPETTKKILDPKVVKRVGRPTFKRKISKAEEVIQRAKKRRYNRKVTQSTMTKKLSKNTVEYENGCDIGVNDSTSPHVYDPPKTPTMSGNIKSTAFRVDSTPISNSGYPITPPNFYTHGSNLSTNLSGHIFHNVKMEYDIGGDCIVDQDAASINNLSTGVCSFSQLLNMVSSVGSTVPKSSIGYMEVREQCGTNGTTTSMSILERQVLDYIFDRSLLKQKKGQVEETLSQIDGFSIKRDEIIVLQDHSWLGDQVLNMYIKLINLDRETNDRYVFLTFLASRGKYIKGPPRSSNKPSKMLSGAMKFFSQQCHPSRCGYNIFNCKWLIFPICLHSHWVAFAIDLMKHKIEILDTLYDKILPGLDEIIYGVLIILEELSKDFGEVIFNHKMYSTDTIPLAKIVRQENTWDCGVLLIKVMESWYGKITTEIDKDMADKYRLDIATSIVLSHHNELRNQIIEKATERSTNL